MPGYPVPICTIMLQIVKNRNDETSVSGYFLYIWTAVDRPVEFCVFKINYTEQLQGMNRNFKYWQRWD